MRLQKNGRCDLGKILIPDADAWARVVGKKRSIAFSAIPMLPIRNMPCSSTAGAIVTEPRLEGGPPQLSWPVWGRFQTGPPHRAAGQKRLCIALPAALMEINRAAASFLAGPDCSMGARVSEGLAVQGSWWGFRLRHD